MAPYLEHTLNLPPAALYTLVDLIDAELEDCQRECESGCVKDESYCGTCARLAPQPRFIGQPLRAVFDYQHSQRGYLLAILNEEHLSLEMMLLWMMIVTDILSSVLYGVPKVPQRYAW